MFAGCYHNLMILAWNKTMKSRIVTLLVVGLFSFSAVAQDAAQQPEWLNPLVDIYKQQLGSVTQCNSQQDSVATICSESLKNQGNAPYVLHHKNPTAKTVVLFHGLSDSPFFFKSIAPTIHDLGFTVIVALLPGHGLKNADADMEDGQLAKRWSAHIDEVVDYAHSISEKVYIGGFSTGGALTALHIIDHPETINGLLLFSGALALDESVEDMAGIWGIKMLAKFLDGDYQAKGPNPYKYPSVARHSAFMLVDVIFEIREKLASGKRLDLPIFTAHSMADVTTPWHGVEALLQANSGIATEFLIEKSFDVCHADVVVNKAQLIEMSFDETQLQEPEKCSIPKANPLHQEMLWSMKEYLIRF